jgi:hypothetical protein
LYTATVCGAGKWCVLRRYRCSPRHLRRLSLAVRYSAKVLGVHLGASSAWLVHQPGVQHVSALRPVRSWPVIITTCSMGIHLWSSYDPPGRMPPAGPNLSSIRHTHVYTHNSKCTHTSNCCSHIVKVHVGSKCVAVQNNGIHVLFWEYVL